MISRPIAVISYNRPDLLKIFLESLKQQSCPIDVQNVALFQDNGDPANDACIATFQDCFPEGQVFAAESNLGVALNIDRAERYIFEKLGADVGYFFEDDLILGPHYIAALNQLADFALNNERVGYVAAYGSHKASLGHQIERNTEVVPMDHKWGFALTRRQWMRQRPIIEPYLDIIRQRPYRQRDDAAIKAYFRSLGYPSNGTSQDGAKDVASLVLGTTKVMSFACFAKYEGRDGLHMRPDVYEDLGYHQTELFSGEPNLVMPSSETLDEWIAQNRANIINDEKKLETLLGARSVVVPQSAPQPPSRRRWSPDDIKPHPHMEAEGVALLQLRLMSASCVLEYGAGGSTVMAASMGVPAIISVESDPDYLAATNAAVCAHAKSIAYHPHYVDIGPTGDWGNPIDRSKVHLWPCYPSSVWSRIEAEKLQSPDLVLIDGRFRVACMLTTVLLAARGTRILFDDYYDRPRYHVVEKYISPVSRAGRMAEFVVPKIPVSRTIISELLSMSTDFT